LMGHAALNDELVRQLLKEALRGMRVQSAENGASVDRLKQRG